MHFPGHKQANNQPKQPQDRTENLYHKHFDEPGSRCELQNIPQSKITLLDLQAWVRCVSQCCTASIDTHRDATYEVTHPHCHSRPE